MWPGVAFLEFCVKHGIDFTSFDPERNNAFGDCIADCFGLGDFGDTAFETTLPTTVCEKKNDIAGATNRVSRAIVNRLGKSLRT